MRLVTRPPSLGNLQDLVVFSVGVSCSGFQHYTVPEIWRYLSLHATFRCVKTNAHDDHSPNTLTLEIGMPRQLRSVKWCCQTSGIWQDQIKKGRRVELWAIMYEGSFSSRASWHLSGATWPLPLELYRSPKPSSLWWSCWSSQWVSVENVDSFVMFLAKLPFAGIPDTF